MIAVSGANGFLGSYVVCRLIDSGKNVRALKRSTSSLSEFNQIFSYYFRHRTDDEKARLGKLVAWMHADVTEIPALEEALEGVTEMYHCAAVVSFLQRDRDMMMHINAEGTANVVNVCLSKKVRKLCHVSSIAALGRAASGAHITEGTHWTDSKHNSNYAVSKHKAEMEVWRGIEEGLDAVIVNPGVILGAGDWGKGSCRLFDLVWRGMPFYTDGVNGYVDVDDVAGAMVMLMEKNISRERFILVADNLSMHDYIDQVADRMGKKRPSIRVTPFISEIARFADGLLSVVKGKDPALTKETASASLKQYFYSSAKITERTGFAFKPLRQTIDETCAAFLEQKKN